MDKASIYYHDIFDFPLNSDDLIKWKTGKNSMIPDSRFMIQKSNGFSFIKGKERLVQQRLQREKISAKKLEIARKASKILSFIPTVKMIAVTGSLAMKNSTKHSDIDLMIITSRGKLWTTRAFAYLLICLFGIRARRPNDLHEKDKLCLNIWMDESDLGWRKKDQNAYSAHELGQILPLVNKENTYERLLYANRWILAYWPNAVVIENLKLIKNLKLKIKNFNLVEKFCYWAQYGYMRSKITRELITPTRALFHPQDWGKTVLTRLGVLD